MMVEHPPPSDNPGPLALRASVEAVRRLREILLARRCIICVSPLAEQNSERLRIFDFAVCNRPECAQVVLGVPLSELTDDLTDGDRDDE